MRWRYHKDILWFLRLMEWQDICKKDTFVLNVEQTFLKKRWKIELQVGLASVDNVMRITFISLSYQIKITSLISMIVWLNPLIVSLSPRWCNNYIIFSLILHWWSVYHRKILLFLTLIVSMNFWLYNVSNIFELQK